jgi:hypothetical protein
MAEKYADGSTNPWYAEGITHNLQDSQRMEDELNLLIQSQEPISLKPFLFCFPLLTLVASALCGHVGSQNPMQDRADFSSLPTYNLQLKT